MKFGFDIQNMNERRDVVILVLLKSAETGLSKDTTFTDLMHGVKLCLSWRFLIRNFDFPEIEQTFEFYDRRLQCRRCAVTADFLTALARLRYWSKSESCAISLSSA
jgi:hypothetical protein